MEAPSQFSGANSSAERALAATLCWECPDPLPPHVALLLDHADDAFSDPLAINIAMAVRSLIQAGTPVESFSVASALPLFGDATAGDVAALATSALSPELAEYEAAKLWKQYAARRLRTELLTAADALEKTGNPALVAKGVEGALRIIGAEREARPAARPWLDVALPPDDDSILIGPGRWLTRGSGCFITAPTGIGKSTLSATLSYSFALGRECLGFKPARPLKSLIVQAEDDDGDLVAMRAGILYAIQPGKADLDQLRANVLIHTERANTGEKFLSNVVQPLLEANRPDLIWLNPVSAFFGDDLNDQRAVAKFFRNGLNPLLARYGCAAFPVHHTAKPTKEKSGWTDGAAAYLSAGHSDLANWSRETITLREIMPGLFELACSKRWRHLGWTDPEGRPARVRRIAHGEGGLQFWRDATPDILNDMGARPYSDAALVALIPLEGMDKAELVRQAVTEFSIGERTAKNYVADLSRVRTRLVNGTKFKCALVRETERDRKEVYPEKRGNRPVVWLTPIGGGSASSSAALVQADELAQPHHESASGGSGATHSLSVALPPEPAGEAAELRQCKRGIEDEPKPKP